jgi:hypothetical protein
MTAARYFDLVREMKDHAYNHRLRLVESARERGIKPTAQLFATTVPTVRKWLRHFQQHGLIQKRRSASASAVFAWRIQQHLDRYGVSLRDLVWQTDNGGEFKGDFSKTLGDSQRVRIPPAAHTYQSDVETVHRLEEDEFFDLEDFSSRGDFLAKAHTYQLYFNLVRPNSRKENQRPRQIIERPAPRSPLQLC